MMTTMRTNQGRLPSAHLWPTPCKNEATGEAGGPFSRGGRGGKRRSPAALAIHRYPLEISSELTLSAALYATGGTGGTSFQHDRSTSPTHKANTEAYKKAQESKKRAPANVWETKVEVCKDELSKLKMVGRELPKEI